MTSLLDAARRLVDGPCPTYYDVELVGTVGRLGPDQGTVLKCAHCRRKLHDPDCSWLRLPQIVAALEAAERVTYGYTDGSGRLPASVAIVVERIGTLAAALRGGEGEGVDD